MKSKLLCALWSVCLSIATLAQTPPTCTNLLATGSDSPASEDLILAKLEQVIADADLCKTGQEPQCVTRASRLKSLQADVEKLEATEHFCAIYAANADSTLAKSEKEKYAAHDKPWLDLLGDMKTKSSAVKLGTYTIPDTTRQALTVFNLQPVPEPPAIIGPVYSGNMQIQVTGQPPEVPFTATDITICSSEHEPTPTTSDCNDPACKGVCFRDGGTPGRSVTHLPLGSKQTSYDLSKRVDTNIFLWLIQKTKDNQGRELTTYAKAVQVLAKPPACTATIGRPFRDCQFLLSLIGGVEQAGLASQPSTTTGFLRFFLREPLGRNVFGWTAIRLLGAPQQTATQGIVSAFTDPSGTVMNYNFSSVGQSIDFAAGAEYLFQNQGTRPFTFSLVGGGGFTTPLTTDSINRAFTAPPLGTAECVTLVQNLAHRTATNLANYGVYSNDPAHDLGTTPGACLLNYRSPHQDASVSPPITRYDPVTTVAFENQDRSNFLSKVYLGVRIITRFRADATKPCDASDNRSCHLGMVDLLVGKDAVVNGGDMRKLLFKIDGIHPLPIKNAAFIYLFGSYTAHMQDNVYYRPLVLKAVDIATLTGSSSTNPIPNVNTVVLPLQQPDRDFYRVGIGVDVICVFSKIFTSNSECLAATPKTTGAAQ